MGERSQMYVKAERTYQMHDESWRTDKGFLPLYFQWNVPENMVARAKQMIYTNMYDYLLVSGKKAWEHEVQAMAEVNYSANKGNPSFSHASNLKKEIRDNIKDAPRWKGREFTKEEKWEEMSSVFYCDNNHGCFYLSVSINQECKGPAHFDIKYAFEDSEGNLLSAQKYIEQSIYEPENPEICQENVEYIEKFATLMTERELEQFKIDGLSIMAKENRMNETEIKEMVYYLKGIGDIKDFEEEPEMSEPVPVEIGEER